MKKNIKTKSILYTIPNYPRKINQRFNMMNNRKSRNNSRSVSQEKDDFSDLSDQDIPTSIHKSSKEGYYKKSRNKNKPRSFNQNYDNYSMSNKFRKQKSGIEDNYSMRMKKSNKNYYNERDNDSFKKK